jgi:hypothetical protein
MTILIITPSFGQLNWLRMCVASVADQVGTQYKSAKVKGAVTDAKQRPGQQKVKGGKVGEMQNAK